jgi:hypothetical protein
MSMLCFTILSPRLKSLPHGARPRFCLDFLVIESKDDSENLFGMLAQPATNAAPPQASLTAWIGLPLPRPADVNHSVQVDPAGTAISARQGWSARATPGSQAGDDLAE